MATRGLAWKLEKPLHAKVYFSKGLQAPYHNHEVQLMDKLEDLQAYSRGWMEISSVDPTNRPELMEEAEKGAVLDSALIAAAQKVEHYEIASYGALCNMAKKLGFTEAADLLHEILEQEKATDEKLTSVCDGIEDSAMEQAA